MRHDALTIEPGALRDVPFSALEEFLHRHNVVAVANTKGGATLVHAEDWKNHKLRKKP